jgi:uncharacterized membrane-anchored protein
MIEKRVSAGLCIAAALLLAAPAAAQTQPAGEVKARIEAAWKAAEKSAVAGPADVPLAGEAHLKIAPGEFFIPGDDANRIMAAMGNSASPRRQGIIVGKGKDSGWLVDVDWVREGYVKDGDAKDWKPDEMLQNLKEGTEQQNAERIAKGFPAMEITGWVQPPAYDAATHRLVWSLGARDRGAPANAAETINYNTYALGREGYFSLDLITGADTVAADKQVAADLLANLAFVPGKRYEDFNGSTDKVAAYGLAALVGVVAAKKIGLIAMMGLFFVKAWKILLLGFAAVAAGVRRFFGRRGEAPDEVAAQPVLSEPVAADAEA